MCKANCVYGLWLKEGMAFEAGNLCSGVALKGKYIRLILWLWLAYGYARSCLAAGLANSLCVHPD